MFPYIKIPRLNRIGLGVFEHPHPTTPLIYCVPNTRVNETLWVQLTTDRYDKRIAKPIYAFTEQELPQIIAQIKQTHLPLIPPSERQEAETHLDQDYILTHRKKAQASCPNIWDCPGCSFIDYTTQEQQYAQQQSHIASISRITNQDNQQLHQLVQWKTTTPSTQYRTKLSARPIIDSNQHIHFGIQDRWQTTQISLTKCVVQNTQSKHQLQIIEDRFNQSQDPITTSQLLQHLKNIVIYAIQEITVIIIIHNEHLEIQEQNPLFQHLINCLNPQPNQSIYTQLSSTLTPKKSYPLIKYTGIDPYFEDEQEHPSLKQKLKFYFTPPSWVSQNPSSIKELRSILDEIIAQQPSDISCVEFGCGVGILTLWIAHHFKHILGVDIVYSAILDAQKNASFANLTNVKFRCADAKKIVVKLKKEGIFDPTTTFTIIHAMRSELHPLLEQLASTSVEQVVYFAPCAASLARDLSDASMWKLKKIYLIDQMPGTAQSMVVAWLIKEQEIKDVLL